MNIVALLGRMVADPELKSTQNGTSVCSFRVAVDRDYTPKGQERQADFITCVAWRGTADFVSRYFTKGKWISVRGSLQTRSYQGNDGKNHTVYEVVAEKVGFVGNKEDSVAQGQFSAPPAQGQAYGAPAPQQGYAAQPQGQPYGAPPSQAGYGYQPQGQQYPQQGYGYQQQGGYAPPPPQQPSAPPPQAPQQAAPPAPQAGGYQSGSFEDFYSSDDDLPF